MSLTPEQKQIGTICTQMINEGKAELLEKILLDSLLHTTKIILGKPGKRRASIVNQFQSGVITVVARK